MDCSYLYLCSGYGFDVLERSPESGFFKDGSLYPEIVPTLYGGGSFSGCGFCGRGRVHDLVSAKGNWRQVCACAFPILLLDFSFPALPLLQQEDSQCSYII